jgi:hypothetical protein
MFNKWNHLFVVAIIILMSLGSSYQSSETQFWAYAEKSRTCNLSIIAQVPATQQNEIAANCTTYITQNSVVSDVHTYWVLATEQRACYPRGAFGLQIPSPLLSQLIDRCVFYRFA